MGKVRKRKQNKGSNDVVSSNVDEEELIVDSKENAIQTIIDQLQTANVEEKYCGLQTFAMLIENPETLEQMINRGLLKIVGPLLIDQAAPVRNAAAGSLRNVSAIHSDLCDILMEHDIMTPLICYFHQYTEFRTPDPSSNTTDEDIDTFIQCTNLLLNICESSGLAVKYLGNSKVLDSIFPRYLDLPTFGPDVVTAVLQCLFVVLEENPVGIAKIKTSSEQQLKELLFLENIMNQILGTLAKTLSVDHRLASNQLSSNVPLGDAAGKVEVPKGKEGLQLQKQIKSVMQILDAQQNALEIIANICSCEIEESTSDEPVSSESDEADEEMCTSSAETQSSTPEAVLSEDVLPPVILEAFISLEIYDKVWARTQMPPENVLLILKEYEGSQLIYKKLVNLQTKALLCINNLLLSLPLENLGGINGVYKIWVEAGKMAFKQNSENLNLLEAATSAMRAGLDKIKLKINENLSETNLFHELALSDIEIMLTGIRECQVAEIRSNLIRMIGSLALLLVSKLNDTTTNVICTITEFILDQAHKENEVWVLAEAIDTLVDLYAEDDTDVLAVRVKLMDKLKILAPILKNKARQQNKLPKEYRVLVNTATSNLPRFIKYKKQRLAALK
ncbi:unnamed protein product, partial [Brenthis ino]